VQTSDMTLELQCDRLRFAPAGYVDSEGIVSKQGDVQMNNNVLD